MGSASFLLAAEENTPGKLVAALKAASSLSSGACGIFSFKAQGSLPATWSATCVLTGSRVLVGVGTWGVPALRHGSRGFGAALNRPCIFLAVGLCLPHCPADRCVWRQCGCPVFDCGLSPVPGGDGLVCLVVSREWGNGSL